MPGSGTVPTQTTITIVSSIITIRTSYFNSQDSGVINAFIMELVGGQVIDGIPFIEGEGGITLEDNLYPGDLNFFLNSIGELIVVACNASSFSVDSSTGQLQYTT